MQRQWQDRVKVFHNLAVSVFIFMHCYRHKMVAAWNAPNRPWENKISGKKIGYPVNTGELAAQVRLGATAWKESSRKDSLRLLARMVTSFAPK